MTDDPLYFRDRVIREATQCFGRAQPDAAIALLRNLEFAPIDATTLRLTDPFLRQFIARGRKIVASFDPARIPSLDEIVIIYGNYPHIFDNIVVNNPMKRHIASFWDIEHDVIEHDERWNPVEQIYVINADSRLDRRDSIFRELSLARAPFGRITRIPAIVPSDPSLSPQLSGTIGCLRSHIEVLRRALARGLDHILVLEDDFCFTSDLNHHMQDLHQFFERRYSYWICLLATSKHGKINQKDDLVSLSLQKCTNAGAYLVSRDGLEQLLPVWETALERLTNTGDTLQYAADRSWSVLQDSGKFLVFRRKFGFQTASYCDIEGSVSRYLD
jgi:GR25 family glycosyltransferase involved in LPS biosynthesis